jgi:hypothetical protein
VPDVRSVLVVRRTGQVSVCKPGSALRPLPGIAADVVDDTGTPVPDGAGGYLVLTEPWPGMPRVIWGDEQRYVDTYWSRFPGLYFAGNGAKKDEAGDIWLLGRVDDVMNVSGHRISTTEVESALVSHLRVAEPAVVGAADPTTGQGVVAFVILRGDGGAPGTDGSAGRGGGGCRTALHRRPGDRPDRQAAPDPAGRGAPQDPLRQDHAPSAAGRGREPRPRRRHDPHGLLGDGRDPGAVAVGGAGSAVGGAGAEEA